MKPINLLILLVLVAGAIYAAVHFSSQGGDTKTTKDDDAMKDAPRVEERYGFTTETVDP